MNFGLVSGLIFKECMIFSYALFVWRIFYEPGCRINIKLSLRRTLVLSNLYSARDTIL